MSSTVIPSPSARSGSSASSGSSGQYTEAPIAAERLARLAAKSRESKDEFETLVTAYEQMIRNQLQLITIGNDALVKQQTITRNNEEKIQQLNGLLQTERERLNQCSTALASQNKTLETQRNTAQQFRTQRAECETSLRATVDRLVTEQKQLQEQFTLTTANLAECLRQREEKSRV